MRDSLLTLSQFGIFFTSLFGGFVRQIAPPDERRFWVSLASVIAAVMFVLVRLQSKRLTPSKRKRRFYGLAVLTPISIVIFIFYQGLVENRVASYGQVRRVIGTELTERGQWAKESQKLSNDELLEQNAGNPQGIWTERSIKSSRMVLGCVYALSVGLFALGLIAACEALKESPPRRRLQISPKQP